jgi:hypothetical protein
MNVPRALFALVATLVPLAAGCAAANAPAANAPAADAPAADAPAGSPGAASPAGSPVSQPAPSSAAAKSERLATHSIADWTGFPDAGQLDVTFHLNEHCAFLQGPPEEPVLLVWPDGRAWIDPGRPDTVRLREPVSGKITEVTDGRRVNLGGAPATNLRPFVTPPHKSCPTGRVFLVTQIN